MAMLSTSKSSIRVQNTEPPYIENVLEKYADIPDIKILALGSSYWTPPTEALDATVLNMDRSLHRYGAILGETNLINKLKDKFQKKGVCLDGLDFVITCGANQAFLNIALALCDDKQKSVVIAPYYFCHKTSLQLAGSSVTVCPFCKTDLMPDWTALESIVNNDKPVLIALTSPSNPSGTMWSREDFKRLVKICKPHNTWIVVDQAYEDFTYEADHRHFIPCSKWLEYENIIHIFSFSKQFGMPGWRVGYTLAPSVLTYSFRKIQDTIPTHAPMISQKLALQCLLHDEKVQSLSTTSTSWIQNKINSLKSVREAVWSVIESLGTVKTHGAFYYLVPLPEHVDEEEAVDLLANKYKVLLMTGHAFGAPGHLRLSYGSLSPADSLEGVTRLRDGFEHLKQLSKHRHATTTITTTSSSGISSRSNDEHKE